MYKHVLHDHLDGGLRPSTAKELAKSINYKPLLNICLLYTSDAADDMQCVDLGGRRII